MEEYRGDMQAVPALAMGIGIAEPPNERKELTLQRHQELSTLAYRIKKFIDAEGGLNDQESCIFGEMMTRIIRLK